MEGPTNGCCGGGRLRGGAAGRAGQAPGTRPDAAFPLFLGASSAAAAAPAQQKIRIKLKSYWVDLLHDAVDKIQAAASDTGASIAGPVPLPTRKKVYTVLRSPHVNKDSREQFEVRLHQRLIDIKDLSSGTIDRLMSLDLPAGVDIEVG
jgi:small subunit ribosomal protein S10